MSMLGGFSRMADRPPSQGFCARLCAPFRSFNRQLSRIKIPFEASLIDKTKPYFSGVKRFGISTFSAFWNDPFHSLLNLNWGRFILVFFITYLLEFIIFAFFYWAMPSDCITGLDGQFSNALWMSSRAASTLGFNDVRPNPWCARANVIVMMQCIASSLINFTMLGVVFARFSAPFKRAATMRFSKVAVVQRHPSGYWCISMRVANLGKHQILRPGVRAILTAKDSTCPQNYMLEHLALENQGQQEVNLELGFPGQVVHVIRPDSPLYHLSLLEMDTRMMEILVFVDGIDAMTSKHMSARYVYASHELLLNHDFVPLHLELRGKTLGLNFNNFDGTVLLDELDPVSPSEPPPPMAMAMGPGPSTSTSPEHSGTHHPLWQLRHYTFKKLAEHYAHLPVRQTVGGASGTGFTQPVDLESPVGTRSHAAAADRTPLMADVEYGLHGNNIATKPVVAATTTAGLANNIPMISMPGSVSVSIPGIPGMTSVVAPGGGVHPPAGAGSATSSPWSAEQGQQQLSPPGALPPLPPLPMSAPLSIPLSIPSADLGGMGMGMGGMGGAGQLSHRGYHGSPTASRAMAGGLNGGSGGGVGEAPLPPLPTSLVPAEPEGFHHH